MRSRKSPLPHLSLMVSLHFLIHRYKHQGCGLSSAPTELRWAQLARIPVAVGYRGTKGSDRGKAGNRMRRPRVYKGIQLAQLRSFCLAAAEGNFRAAARLLGLSVPTVWQQVRALERELGVVLLRRRGRAVELTPEGRLLQELVQPHLGSLDSLVPLFQSRRADLPVRVTVASTNYLLSYHLPKPVQEFVARYPTVHLSLPPGAAPAPMRLRERGEADGGAGAPAPAEPRCPYLHYEHLFDLRFTLLTAADHPLARKKRLAPADLVQY